ncbi:Spermidine synthase [Gracilaria domingensis]|nr:Spermidine synthase [Gracilaria domingensis]
MGLEKPPPSDNAGPTQESAPTMWIVEQITPHDAYHHGVKQLLVSKNTKFQAMTIADVGAYGRALFLDGRIQTTEGDEPFYHEPLVHLPCLVHSNPESVLILGGADGGAAREALRWHSVKSVFIVDIDGEAVDACRKYLPNIARGSLDDPRCKLIVGDALSYMDKNKTPFDVIICDLTDPMENSPSLRLFTKEFFSNLKQSLKPMGVISVMSGPTSLRESKLFQRTFATLSFVFKSVRPSQVFVPTYGSPLGILLATDNMQPLPEPSQLDLKINKSIKGEMHVLDGASVHGHFAIPRCLRKAVMEETQIFTIGSQVPAFGKGILNNKG